MAFEAIAMQVMIASPSDVARERDIIREVLHTWNNIHAVERKIVLLPTGWETHSFPRLGSRPQQLINKHVLKDCDILIGVFWTRLGTPTENASSGTVEEIEEHVRLGKPAMLYFSSAPVRPDSIDSEQYSSLTEFKERCRAWGLYESYDAVDDFKEKFFNQLQLCLNGDDYIKKLCAEYTTPTVLDYGVLPDLPANRISQDARIMVRAASKDSYGTIYNITTIGGHDIQAGGLKLAAGAPRQVARWEKAIRELLDHQFIKPEGSRGQLYKLTHEGWELADTLSDDLLSNI